MNWWQRLVHAIRTRILGQPLLATAYVDDVPDQAVPRVVYLVGEGRDRWISCMSCPCGCGALLQLSLMANDKPRWQASVDWLGMTTLHPSVWRVVGCRSHFFLRHGRIEWA
jgi:hypothetical protein